MEIITERVGGEVELELYFEKPVPDNYAWYKFNEDDGWIDFSEYTSLNKNRNIITIKLVDGGPGDDDGLPNGKIVDPSGLGTFTIDDGESNSIKPDEEEGADCFIGSINGRNDNYNNYFFVCFLLFSAAFLIKNFRRLM